MLLLLLQWNREAATAPPNEDSPFNPIPNPQSVQAHLWVNMWAKPSFPGLDLGHSFNLAELDLEW